MKAFILLLLAAVALADNPRPAYNPTPSYNRPTYSRPSFNQYEDRPTNYQYSYEVNDGHYGPRFNAEESRNGYATTGSYSVDLPDGRVQTVTYTVSDGYSGYVADVSYEGEAQYPEQRTYKPAPSYAPRPSYRPAPTYN